MPVKTQKLLAFLILIVFLFAHYLSKPAKAAISACSASVDTGEVQPNVNDITFTFTVTNDDAVDIKWFRITKPFSGLTTTGVLLSDWRKATQGEVTLFTDGTLTPGNSVSPRITVNVGDIAGSSGNWLVEVSDDTGGASPFTCSGSLGLTVTAGATDVTAPQISSLAVSSITSSSAVISWTSDESATSLVEYGLETDTYSLNKSSSSLTTSHSLSPDNLGAGTTYYYRVCSTDAAGNQGCSSESSFTTLVATTVLTPTPTTVTVTVTETVVSTPTPSIARFPQKLPKEELPGQLFDISLELEADAIIDVADLIARVMFTNFGTEPAPVDLVFIILDQEGTELYQAEGNTVVETEAVFTQTFENVEMDLVDGKYTLLLKTLYNVDVEDEFRADFTIEKSGFNWKLSIFAVVLLLSGIYYRLSGRSKKKRKKKQKKLRFLKWRKR